MICIYRYRPKKGRVKDWKRILTIILNVRVYIFYASLICNCNLALNKVTLYDDDCQIAHINRKREFISSNTMCVYILYIL